MTRRASGQGTITPAGYIVKNEDGRQRLEHLFVAEKALGKPLPAGAQVHHIDNDRKNNHPSNLVLCPDASYHRLLHVRQAAFEATGSYEWRKCHLCLKYDEPENLHIGQKTAPQRAYHKACNAQRQRQLRQQRKESK